MGGLWRPIGNHFWDSLESVAESSELSYANAKKLLCGQRDGIVKCDVNSAAIVQKALDAQRHPRHPVAMITQIKHNPPAADLQKAEKAMRDNQDNTLMLAFLRSNC